MGIFTVDIRRLQYLL